MPLRSPGTKRARLPYRANHGLPSSRHSCSRKLPLSRRVKFTCRMPLSPYSLLYFSLLNFLCFIDYHGFLYSFLCQEIRVFCPCEIVIISKKKYFHFRRLFRGRGKIAPRLVTCALIFGFSVLSHIS